MKIFLQVIFIFLSACTTYTYKIPSYDENDPTLSVVKTYDQYGYISNLAYVYRLEEGKAPDLIAERGVSRSTQIPSLKLIPGKYKFVFHCFRQGASKSLLAIVGLVEAGKEYHLRCEPNGTGSSGSQLYIKPLFADAEDLKEGNR